MSEVAFARVALKRTEYNVPDIENKQEDSKVTIQFDAVFQDGVLLPKQPVALPNGTEVRVAVETREVMPDPLADVIGSCDGPTRGDTADRHDDYIYGDQQP
jgi:predicted DNA-binding antitoxin AbrB/MazE fold protein